MARGLLLALLLVGSVATTSGGSAVAAPADLTFSVASCASRLSSTHGAGCGAPLLVVLKSLRAGDTLRIAPGSYDVDSMSLAGPSGTSSSRIRVTALDPAHRPLLRGWTHFSAPKYLTVSDIDFEATVPDKGGLHISCGVGWTLQNSHLFGADTTQAVYNLMISGRITGPPNPDDGHECTDGGPRGFLVRNSTFNRPFVQAPGAPGGNSHWQHIYAAFEGSVTTGGTIEHNLFVGARSGAGVKLGDGLYHTLGPWNVAVKYNTFYNGKRGILLADDVRNNTIVGNLVVKMSEYGIAVNKVPDPSNSIGHTYAFNVSSPWRSVWNDGSTVQDLGDNLMRPDPLLVGYGLYPSTALAQQYGWTSPNAFG
jgi:hypothetical protein